MMSNFKIVHEIDGRLRVRFGQYAFTNEQATILKSDFLKLEYVRYVEAHYKNGSLLLVFDENYKNEVFGYLKSYDLSTLQNREIPKNCSQNLQVKELPSIKHLLILKRGLLHLEINVLMFQFQMQQVLGYLYYAKNLIQQAILC